MQKESPSPNQPDLAYLQLLHLADSAFPIGALSHSFGLETLVAANQLSPKTLEIFLQGYLEEAGVAEAVFCREATKLANESAAEFPAAQWRELNETLSALKPARESRDGSASLGRNFLKAVAAVAENKILRQALEAAENPPAHTIEHSPAFGLTGGALKFDENAIVLSYLHQWATNSVSAVQRLSPLGQTQATQILWNLKPAILEAANRSAKLSPDNLSSFTPMLDWGAMEHPALTTRLFIS
jgi:urease accessory protein